MGPALAFMCQHMSEHYHPVSAGIMQTASADRAQSLVDATSKKELSRRIIRHQVRLLRSDNAAKTKPASPNAEYIGSGTEVAVAIPRPKFSLR